MGVCICPGSSLRHMFGKLSAVEHKSTPADSAETKATESTKPIDFERKSHYSKYKMITENSEIVKESLSMISMMDCNFRGNSTDLDFVLLSACQTDPRMEVCTQTDKTMIYILPLNIINDESSDKEWMEESCMGHDIVLLSACSKLDASGNPLTDAWTQTSSKAIFHSSTPITDSKSLDDLTMVNDEVSIQNHESEDPDKNLGLTQKIIKICQKIGVLFHSFPKINAIYQFKYVKMGLLVSGCLFGVQYGPTILKRIGFVILCSGAVLFFI